MNDLVYLIVVNWPFLAIALLIGIAAGWYGAPNAWR